MNKLLMLSAAALAFAAIPAYATDTTTTFGPAGTGLDAQQRDASWALNGSAADYCTLGAAAASSGANTSITTTGGAAGGTVDITQFQGTGDHANSWNAVITFQNAICNTNFTVTGTSQGVDGLAFQGPTPADPHFAVNAGYLAKVSFGGVNGGNTQANQTSVHHQAPGTRVLLGNGVPTVSPLTLTLTGNADSTKYLLAGNYTDSFTVSLVPTV